MVVDMQPGNQTWRCGIPALSQWGGALIEFIVLGAAMVPLFLMFPTLGKIADVNHTSIIASRYAAWEQTIAPGRNGAALNTEINQRFFAKSDLPVYAPSAQPQGEDARNPLWQLVEKDNGGKPRGLIANNGGITGDAVNRADSQTSTALILSNAIAEAGGMLAGAIPDAQWDVEGKGLYVGIVNTNLHAGALFPSGEDCTGGKAGGIFACIKRHNAILVDGWGAADAEHAAARTRAWVPFGVARPVGDFLSVLGALPPLQELGKLDGMFGHVEPDVLPPDRVGKRP